MLRLILIGLYHISVKIVIEESMSYTRRFEINIVSQHIFNNRVFYFKLIIKCLLLFCGVSEDTGGTARHGGAWLVAEERESVNVWQLIVESTADRKRSVVSLIVTTAVISYNRLRTLDEFSLSTQYQLLSTPLMFLIVAQVFSVKILFSWN